MSTSTDAILFFGMCWDEEGLPLDEDVWSEDEDEEASNDLDIDDLDRTYAKIKGLDYTKLPFEFFTHCHREAPMLALAVKGTVTRAWRGSPKEIDPFKLQRQAVGHGVEDEKMLEEVCKTLGIKPGKFGWWLVSEKFGWWLVSDWS